MLEEFIKNKHTYKNEDRDFVEWHKGQKRYAIWAIEVENKQWLNQLAFAREILQQYLLQGQQRTMHITLFACGFYEECVELIELQKLTLKNSDLEVFKLGLSGLDSFLSAPFFSISDATNSINNIRAILEKHMNEDRSGVYCPHLTVGQYNDAHSTVKLSEIIEACKGLSMAEVLVKKISLMTYDTKSIFSPLHTEFEIKLVEECD